MAGPMVGPVLDELPVVDLSTFYWTPDGNFPDHEPNPLLAREPRVHHREGQERGRAARDRLGRRRRPLLLHRRERRVRRRRLPDGAARRVDAGEVPRRRRSFTTCAPAARVADTVGRAGGTPCVNRVGHAFFKARMHENGALFGGEVSGHYYFRDFGCIDSGTLPALLILELTRRDGPHARRAGRRVPLEVLHHRRDQLDRRRRAGRDGRDRAQLRRRRDQQARRHQRRLRRTGTSTCDLATPSRCCA